MLNGQNFDFGDFGETELTALLEAGGWEAILPSALQDGQLLAVANEMRDLVFDQNANATRGPGSAALAMTLLLIAINQPSRWGRSNSLDLEIETLHDVLELVSASVDREIVDRVLKRPNAHSGAALMQAIAELTQ